MDTYFRFLQEFLSQFFSGFILIFKAIFEGTKNIFDIPAYIQIVSSYKNDFSGAEWLGVGVAILTILVIVGLVGAILFFAIKRLFRIRKNLAEHEGVAEEIAELNDRVARLVKEKQEILAMKVSQLGLNENESATEDSTNTSNSTEKAQEGESDTRFQKLAVVDKEYANYKIQNYGNNFTLEELCENFRNFAASRLRLYYKIDLIRDFIAGLASSKLVILQGISGTGKTSLAYAWGKFLCNDSCVAAVQPSWRDRTELLGYFNEFTKKFNETKFLEALYIASYTDDIYTVILDEMNLSRVEYYFADMLSILEIPNTDEWIMELAPSGWDSDPKLIKNGKIKIPANTWYIGTINNDDSTFIVTDKVYDRAMPIDINDKGQAFEPIDTPPMHINYTYLNSLFEQAKKDYQISQETLDKVEEMDNYVIKHFRIAFGNRIVSHMKKFVPVYVASGGDEVAGVDYFIAKKILRKFEQLNIAYIRDEIDGFVDFLNKTFGKNKMRECIEYSLRLKKMG